MYCRFCCKGQRFIKYVNNFFVFFLLQRFVENANKPQPELKDDPAVDFSMKQGEKITINLKVKTKSGQTKVSPASTPKNVSLGDGGLLLPPPPASGHKPAPQQVRAAPARSAAPVQQQSAASSKGGMDDFDFLSTPSQPAVQQAPKQVAPQQVKQQPQQQAKGASALDDFLL